MLSCSILEGFNSGFCRRSYSESNVLHLIRKFNSDRSYDDVHLKVENGGNSWSDLIQCERIKRVLSSGETRKVECSVGVNPIPTMWVSFLVKQPIFFPMWTQLRRRRWVSELDRCTDKQKCRSVQLLTLSFLRREIGNTLIELVYRSSFSVQRSGPRAEIEN